MAKVGNMCLEAVEAYDAATESQEALNAAELKFQDIINSPSVDAACKKIDELAQKDQLDPALVLMIGKAWSAAKETDMTRHEARSFFPSDTHYISLLPVFLCSSINLIFFVKRKFILLEKVKTTLKESWSIYRLSFKKKKKKGRNYTI